MFLVLLLEMRQRPRAGRLPVRGAAHVGTDRGLDPFGVIHHPELTVTVADVDRLEEVLRARRERSGPDS